MADIRELLAIVRIAKKLDFHRRSYRLPPQLKTRFGMIKRNAAFRSIARHPKTLPIKWANAAQYLY